MKIIFLTAQQSQDYFKTPDEYAVNLPKSNLNMIVPHNPTVEGYQELFLESFGDFTEEEQARISEYIEKLDWLNLDVKMAKTMGTHSLDITQTRKDVILVTRGLIGEATFIHEVYHVLSRQYPEFTKELSKLFGFKPVTPQKIKAEDFLLNPDALVCDYGIEVEILATKAKVLVTPFVALGLETGLKVVDKGLYIDSKETDYNSQIPNTSYLAHPEEICAEYFSLYHLGYCIFFKQPMDHDKIAEYGKKLEELVSKQGLIIGSFPSAE